MTFRKQTNNPDKMIATTPTQAKRTKPRRQSGEAVKGIQKADRRLVDEAQIEECDPDLQRIRHRVLLLDVAVAEEESGLKVCYRKRSKPRRQSGTAAAADYKRMKNTKSLTFLMILIGLQPMSL
jgi:hypothetical protein